MSYQYQQDPQAIFSGFTVLPKDFIELVKALAPHMGKTRKNPFVLEDFVFAYNHWWSELSDKDKNKAPLVKVCLKPNCDPYQRYEKIVKRLLFPVRWVEYEDDSQLLRDEEHKLLWRPTDDDRAQFDQFLGYIKSLCDGISPLDDIVKYGFTTVKDRRPMFVRSEV
ncbi:hypothetical protein BDZ94DRAFT_1270976 [Collybia nuda]|uniref:Uncharacterized protein n=1 Tax=Collybia nuda TaxID=64659 RepID=A0A9P5XXC5_9AGAR|nr:hypothetical protein BDZ94DRAFT_1270976 [Collybia nuda]